ncbi:hypothetical protein CMO91_06310 [Candidatus Woesearchaeota archaeon]|jgi:hypothetical protein|nr:hypothetical protein [Candidatus Woesearchaeota archaeon]|tara:strand:+ start:690 stop:911 length:222 start_codon:yes stop_codon:yes gene_type:complete
MKALIVVGIIIAILGVVYALLPHEAHMQMSDSHEEGDGHGMQDHASHGKHQTFGWVMAVVGVGLALAGWKIFS